MIKKGYHFGVTCDTDGCDKGFVIGTTSHQFKGRQAAKREVIKKGWLPGLSGTFECNICRKKREVANLKTAKDEIEADSPGFKPVAV